MPTRRHRRAPCRPNDKPTLHEEIIRALIAADPRVCRNGFWQAVRALAKAEGLDADDLTGPHFRPDAYMIDEDRKHINIIEVEVSHPMTGLKKDDCAWFWFLWECELSDWEPRLFVVDRYRHGHELDLRAMYYAKVAADALRAA